MIKNIIFDLGGIILDINPLLAKQGFHDLGVTDIERAYSDWKTAGLFKKFERGQLSAELFRKGIREYLEQEVSDEHIDAAWNAMILGLPIHRLAMLTKLKQNYRIFLLSNTNPIHENYWNSLLRNCTDHLNLQPYFHKVYYSYEMDCRKPEPVIYQRILEEQQLSPQETLFIDDFKKNIDAARELGIVSVLHDPTHDISTCIERYIATANNP